jgi:hypothetical protein
MRSIRVSIAGLMGAVLIAAVCLAALRFASETWAGVTLLATCAVLGLAVVGVVCRDVTERPWWLGFALFGWGYLALAFWSPFNTTKLPTLTLIEALFKSADVAVPKFRLNDLSFPQIAHCFWALLVAILGGMLAAAHFAVPARRSERPATEPQQADQSPRTWWRRPAVIGLSGLALTSTLAVVTSGLTPVLWAGLTFLLTCVLLGFVILGALLVRGRTREIWLGAALFAWGYLILAFGLHPFQATCPYLVTGQLLNTIRPWFPPPVSGLPVGFDRTDPENVRILKILEQPVRMRFPTPTSLDNVLKYIKEMTTGPDGKGIPIYIDPIGLQEAEKSLSSTIQIDLQDVPLRTSLHLCLQQLDLMYEIKDGYIMITYDTSRDDKVLLLFEPPFLIVGHCLLALLAAICGGAAAPLIAGRRERT